MLRSNERVIRGKETPAGWTSTLELDWACFIVECPINISMVMSYVPIGMDPCYCVSGVTVSRHYFTICILTYPCITRVIVQTE